MAYKYKPPETQPAVQSQKAILLEFRRWNDQATTIVIGANDFPAPVAIGTNEATCRFVLRNQPIEVRCATFPTYNINLKCVYLAIQQMRLNEARGIGDTMREAYLMLAPPPKTRDPYEILGVRPDSPEAVIEASFRALAKEYHPDGGHGDAAKMAELNTAHDRIVAERRP